MRKVNGIGERMSARGLARFPGMVGCVLLSSALLLSAPASAWEINFEDSFLDLPNPVVSGQVQGRIIDDEFATAGRIDPNAADHDPTLTAMFSAFRPNGSTNQIPAVLFNSNSPTGGDPDLGAPFFHADTGAVKNPGQILILHEQPSNCRNASGGQVNGNSSSAVSCDDPDDIGARPAGRFEIEFNKAITLTSIDFFDVEEPEAGPGATNEILLFDVDGNQILDSAPFYTPDTGGDNKWKEVVFNVVGVKKIELRMAGSGAIDNIRGTNIPQSDEIPEPSTMLIFGAGMLGAAIVRRRRRQQS